MKKKTLFTAILVGILATSSFAQSIEITPYVGYTFGGRVYGRYGELKVRSSESVGGALAIVMPTLLGLFTQSTRFSMNSEVIMDVGYIAQDSIEETLALSENLYDADDADYYYFQVFTST